MRHILILGATSAMAEACARRWAQRGDRLFLVARQPQALQAVVDDLRTRGANRVGSAIMDATNVAAHAGVLDEASAFMQGLDMVLIAHGTLSDQARAQGDVDYAMRELDVNGTSVVAFMARVAERFAQQGSGAIGVISSVAGDRGRQSNYVYGSAKALVSAFASGLRQRLSKHGVSVTTIKPGFVDSPMTAHLKKGPLWATPDGVASDIVRAMDRGTPVLYTPGFWRFIMLIIKHVPERIFMRLSL